MVYDQHGGDIYRNRVSLDFSVNVNPLGIPRPVRQAFLESLEDLSHYPDPAAAELRTALAVRDRFPADWIICGNGCGDLIFGLVAALKPGRAMVLAPTFSEYENALISVSCEVVYMPLKREEGFPVDSRALIAVLETESRKQPLDLLFLCNPNNPTGLALRKEELRAVADVCKRLGIFLVIDECFCEFLDDWQNYSLREEVAANKQMMILNAMTKTYALAGLRIGYGYCSDELLLQKMTGARQPWSVSLPAQRAGAAAAAISDFMPETRAYLAGERPWFIQELSRIGFRVYPSMANYIFFENPFESRASLYQWCLRAGILIRDCRNYRGLRAGDYRVCVRTRADHEILLKIFRDYCLAVLS